MKLTKNQEKTLSIVSTIFTARWWVIVAIMGILSFLSYYYRTDLKPTDVISITTGGMIFCGLFYTVINHEHNLKQFNHGVKTSRETLSFNIAMEFNQPILFNHCERARAFYLTHKNLLDNCLFDDFQKELDKNENTEAFTSILCLLNYFESVSLGVKQGIMDEEFIKGFFKSIFAAQYNRYIAYIEFRRRDKHNPGIWCNFTTLAHKWHNTP